MQSKRKPLVLLSLALITGLVAAFFAQRWADNRLEAAEEAANSKLTKVIVATVEIGFGKRIEANDIKGVNWPQDAIPPGAFNDAAQLVGKQSKYQIFPGEPILQGRIADEDSPLLAGLIKPNKRAVTVRVDDVVGVAGFLLPGSHVDVLASQALENNRVLTRTVLQDLKVLAVDQTANQGGEDKPLVVRAVTLEADPKQAETLVQATRQGNVQLVLRNPEDHGIPVADETPAPTPVSAPRRSTRAQMTVIRGTQTNSAETRQ